MQKFVLQPLYCDQQSSYIKEDLNRGSECMRYNSIYLFDCLNKQTLIFINFISFLIKKLTFLSKICNLKNLKFLRFQDPTAPLRDSKVHDWKETN